MFKVLTARQSDQYRQDGFLFPIPVLDSEQATHFRAACDALEESLGGRPRTVEVRQMHLHLRWAFELATQTAVLDAVEDLLGPNLLIWATELFAKHPHSPNVAVGWHRDRPYLGFESGESATAWIALSPSTPANGCMRAVPSRFGDGNDGQSCPAVAAGALDPAHVANIVLRPGEMSVHDADVLHGSEANNSDEKRVGFVIRFVTPEARPMRGKPAALLARGRDIHGNFAQATPPSSVDNSAALVQLRRSALSHLDTVLQNLQHGNRSG